MKKSFVEIYGLAVCFVTLLCFVIALAACRTNTKSKI